MAYLDVPSYRGLSLLPSDRIDDIETAAPDWLSNTLDNQSSVIDARLSKRYIVPFALPIPSKVQEWLVRLVDARAYVKAGIDSNDAQIGWILEDAANVLKELQEAADAQNGLWQLPLIQGQPGSNGISEPKVYSTSQASPYSWIREQALRARRHG